MPVLYIIIITQTLKTKQMANKVKITAKHTDNFFDIKIYSIFKDGKRQRSRYMADNAKQAISRYKTDKCIN